MALLLLTTKGRVRAAPEVGGKNWATADTLIEQLVAGVSGAIERWLGRKLLLEARTEDLDLEYGQRVVWLDAYPVASTPAPVVKNDTERLFGADTVIDAASYYVRREGAIEFDRYIPIAGPGVIRVAYTGGLAASTNDLVAAYPDLALACELQVLNILQRRGNLGGTGQSGGGANTSFQGAIDLLPAVKEKPAPTVASAMGDFGADALFGCLFFLVVVIVVLVVAHAFGWVPAGWTALGLAVAYGLVAAGRRMA